MVGFRAAKDLDSKFAPTTVKISSKDAKSQRWTELESRGGARLEFAESGEGLLEARVRV